VIKEYTLQGLGCANCAGAIEGAVGRLEGVSAASLNFATATLRVDFAGGSSDGLCKDIESIVRRHEPDALMAEKARGGSPESGGAGGAEIVRIVSGAAILAVAVLLDWLIGAGGSAPEIFFGMSLPALLGHACAYTVLGGGIVLLAARSALRGGVFNENFLMSLATLGAFGIGECIEASSVMLLYRVGVFFQGLAVDRSKKSIAALMGMRPDFANLLGEGQAKRVPPETVRIGDAVLVGPGEKIPLDGVVLEGEATLDTKALTGESAPRRARPGDAVLSGCINQDGVLTIRATRTFGESTASKIIDLVESAAARKAPTENFIGAFARRYTPAVLCLAALIAAVPPLALGAPWPEWLGRGLVFLVISCPCALVISIPLGFFGGIGGASKNGILVKGGNYLEALAKLDVVVFDKTGTLTMGAFGVTAIQPADGFGGDELLEAAAHCEAFSSHPIALSILREYGRGIDKGRLAGYREMAGYGVSVAMDGAGGTKKLLAGNGGLMAKMGVAFEESRLVGTKVYVAADGAFMGCIVISDEIRPSARRAIAAIKAMGVGKTVMLTGDDARVAIQVADELGIDEAHGGLLPQQKAEWVERLSCGKPPKGKLAFVGDGINDAPALAVADVGVAMGGLGSDAAIEAADVVLMSDEPLLLAKAIGIARFTKRVVRQNIAFALGAKAAFLLLGALGAAGMWEAVFADVGVTVLAVLNSVRVASRLGAG
jgi:Cd2+/Zn2+-exporting ATPase